MKESYHYGWIRECGTPFRVRLDRKWIAIQFRNVGFYIGWFPDDFWAMMKQAGRVARKNPWYCLPFEFPWRSIK